jgi:transposase-like protein
VKELSVELGVSVTTLRNWLRTVSLEKPASAGRVLWLEEQVRRLSKENERLHEEREISKKRRPFSPERGDEIRLHPDAHLHLARCAGCSEKIQGI